MEQNDQKKKSPNVGKIIGVIVALSLLSEGTVGILILVGIVAAVFYLVYKKGKNTGGSGRKDAFDDCPKPICFHKDKGEHHVRKGREIDPWDRPDIDISKYQRR